MGGVPLVDVGPWRGLGPLVAIPVSWRRRRSRGWGGSQWLPVSYCLSGGLLPPPLTAPHCNIGALAFLGGAWGGINARETSG